MNLALHTSPATSTVAVADRLLVRLTSITYAANNISLFEFSSINDIALPPASAGAHIDIHLPNNEVRQYSLVLGLRTDCYIVGIKKEVAGRGGSLYIHDTLKVGNIIEISAPRNNFPLREDAAHTTLIAGGIGITPIWSMAWRLQQLGKSWELHFASRSPEDAAFFRQLRTFSQVQFHFDCENEGRPIDLQSLLAKVPQDAELYCCGPMPMLEAFERASAGRPPTAIHTEYFTPRHEAAAGGFTVRLSQTGIDIEVPAGSSILDALLDAGIVVPYSCTEGICGACQVGVVKGIPDHRDSVLNEEERAANNCMMVCCSGCKEGVLVLDL